MPGRLLLSPVPETGGTLRRPSAGKWYQEPDFLSQFSTDILVKGTVGHEQIVRGVPSVFAQPIYFSHALRDRNHPAHTAAVGQWRGLLACFALKQWLQLQLEAGVFEVGVNDGVSMDDVFRAVLNGQLPEPAEDWRRWWLLRCNGELIGATSPWSLVFPPAESAVPATIPWQRKDVLIDPIDHYDEGRKGRPSRELALLAIWVDQVYAGYEERWKAPVGDAWNRAMSLVAQTLAAWRDDLQPYRQPEDRHRELSTDSLEVGQPYDAFLRSIDASGGTADGLLLRGLAGECIVLKRHGLDKKARVQGSALVEELDLVGMPAEAPTGWETKTGRKMGIPYLFADEVFLSAKLTQIPLSENALSLGDGRFALPLRSKVLRYFSYDDVRNGRLRLRLEETDDGLTVRLTFPLANGDEFSVEKKYDTDTDIIQLDAETAPALTLWPDFFDPDWSHSQAMYVALPSTPLAVAPLAVSGPLERNPEDRDGRDWVLWRSVEPLIGFALYPVREQGEAGLLLRADAKAPPQGDPNVIWRVAVDFGTSNTQLMVATDEMSEPSSLNLKGRTVALSAPGAVIQVEASDAFYPMGGELASPFPTVLVHNQGWAATQTAGAVPGELYSPRFAPKPGARLGGEAQDIKWPRQGAGRADLPIRSFLNIVTQAILAEAVAAGVSNVTFHWSYPIALPPSPKAAMTNFWQTVPDRFSSPSLRVTITEENGRSESEAMSRYFANLPGDLPVRSEALSIAVDVGGGSTDVGFWSAGRFLDQLSFKLAGNDLVVPLARDVPRFLVSLFQICLGVDVDESELVEVRQSPEISVNALLSQERHAVPLALHGSLTAGEPPWSIARSVVYLFFAGTVFYLGVHAQRLLEQVHKKETAILFGGKAAGLLPWLSNDSATLERVLGEMYAAGLGYDDPNLQQLGVTFYGPGLRPASTARTPKVEVAHGLLLPPLPGEKPVAPACTLVGERGWKATPADTEALEWHAEVDVAGLGALHCPESLEAGFATYFAFNLVPRFAEELQLDKTHLRDLQLNVADVENTVRTLASKGVMQPVFASELKRLIDIYLRRVKRA